MSKITNIRKVKQDDKFSIAIRDIQSSNPANKKCFDCDQRGPTYLNMTIGSFVCTKCSGMLRGINPPHRIKSISMSSFTSDEVEMIRNKGNAWCAAVWTGNYNRNTNPVDFKDDEKIKDFIVAKYEKKRYYVDPSQANLSGIKQQLTGGSTGSSDSHNSHKLASSALIGSTLRSRVDPSSASVLSQSGGGNSFVVSRPESGVMTSNTVSQLPVHVPPNVSHVSQPVSQPAPAPATNNGHGAPSASASSNFANFADFDGVAFDSLPSDPLTNPPPSATLPPMNRKPSSGTAAPIGQSAPAAANQSQPALAQSSTQDRYSALAELDDLFRSTAIESPVVAASPAAPALGQQPDLAGLFSSGAKPAPVHNILVSDPSGQPHNGSPGWAAAAPPAPWGQSVSPAAGAWNSAGRSASPAAASGWAGNSNNTSSAAWNSAGRSASPAAAGWAGNSGLPAAGGSPAAAGWGGNGVGSAAGKTSPMWTPQWGDAKDSQSSAATWSDSANKGLAPPLNTNPFGTSPSNPPPTMTTIFSDNNNDLFAAAPKPFGSDKPGLASAGNPWSVPSGPAPGVSSFTSTMTPAHNPNNPFL